VTILEKNKIDINIFREIYKDFYKIDNKLTIEEVSEFLLDTEKY
jgi:hypothetical protein